MTVVRLACAAVGVSVALAGCVNPEEAADEAPLPYVATIVCDANGTTVQTPSVRPQLDGVHVLIENRLDVDPGFSVRFDGGGMGDNAPPGTSEHVVEAPPGTIEIGCYPEGETVGEPDLKELEVVDVDAVYRSVELACGSVSIGTSDYGPDAPGEQGDPVDLARERFDGAFGLTEADIVEPAGYPESEAPIVRLVRDDEVVATIEYRRAEGGGWLEEILSTCGDLAPSA